MSALLPPTAPGHDPLPLLDQAIVLQDGSGSTPTADDADDAGGAEWRDFDCHRALADLPSVSVIIPTLNEEANIGWVLQRMPGWVEEVVVVDGGSEDRTVEVARALRPEVVVITEPRRGKGVALRTGFGAATGEVVVIIDADGSMDPNEIEHYVRAVGEGYDLVKGSRACPGGGSTDLTPIRNKFCSPSVATLASDGMTPETPE